MSMAFFGFGLLCGLVTGLEMSRRTYRETARMLEKSGDLIDEHRQLMFDFMNASAMIRRAGEG